MQWHTASKVRARRHGLVLAAAAWLVPACHFDSAGLDRDGGDLGSDPDAAAPRADADPSCPAAHVRLDPIVPTVLLLLDQSGSMNEAFASTRRWDAMKHVLVDPAEGVVPQLAASVVFGAALYTSDNGGPACPVLSLVMPALDNLAAIDALLQSHEPQEDTPTGAAIVGATNLLGGMAVDPDVPPSPRIIVLATDGEPDTCAVPDPQTEEAKAEAIAAAAAAHAAGLRLFILSIGNEVGLAHQQDMANAGAGKPLDGTMGNAPFYGAENPAELRAVFDTIIGGVRSCTFVLSSSVTESQANLGTVNLNGTPLVLDDPDGWTLVDPTTLELLGDACRAFLQDPSVSLTAEFPCEAVVVE